MGKRQFSPEALKNLRASGKRIGKLKNPNKGFGSNPERARLAGQKSKLKTKVKDA